MSVPTTGVLSGRGVVSCSLATGGLEADGHLEGVVDPPLETGQGTDHEDSGAEAAPQSLEADLAVDFADGAALLVHDGDHGVSGVRDDGAEDTREVAGHESDHQLGALAVRLFGCGEHVGVEGLHGVLERTEFDHRVGDLTGPERVETLVEAGPAFGLHDLGPSLAGGLGESALIGGLHTHFQLYGIEKDKINTLNHDNKRNPNQFSLNHK